MNCKSLNQTIQDDMAEWLIVKWGPLDSLNNNDDDDDEDDDDDDDNSVLYKAHNRSTVSAFETSTKHWNHTNDGIQNNYASR